MFGIGLIEIALVLLVLLGLGWLVARVASQPAGTPVEPQVESRRILLTRTGGLVVGALAAWWTAERGSLGTGVMLAPAVFGLCVLVAMAVGETVVRPARTPGPRTASLRPRRLLDYAPRRLLALVGTQLVAVVALLTLTTVTAGRDEYSGEARSLVCTGATVSQAAGPYPGSFYSVPLAALLLVVLAVAALSSRQVLRRPRGNGEPGSDDVLRRRSLGVVVAALGVALAAPYVGLALSAGSALGNLGTGEPSCAATWMRPVGIALSLSALPALVLALACLVVLLGGGLSATARRDAARR